VRLISRVRFVSYLALLALSASSSAQRQLFHEYGSSDGLSNLNVKCLLQDHTGYLWVGTDNGLFRYDGSTFRGYGHAEGLPNTEILSLAEAPAGVLWIGTNSGVAQASGERFQSVDVGEEGPTRSIGFDPTGKVYLEQDGGILRGVPSSKGSYRFQTVVSGAVSGVFVNGGDILFGKDGGLWTLKGDRAQEFDHSYDLPRDLWGSITEDNLGNLWVRSRTRLYELPRGQAHFLDRSDGIPHAVEAHLYADRHGSILVSTSTGIIVLAGDRRTPIDSRHGLPADPSGPMLIDREELLWLGTDGGGLVRRLGHGEWAAWKREDGLLRSSVWSIEPGRDGNVWVGTNGGLNLLNSSGEVTRTWTNRDGLPGDRVLSLVTGPNGDIYAGTDTGAISHFSRQGALLQTYSAKSGYVADRVSSMAIDGEGRLWAIGIGGCFRTRLPLSAGQLHFDRVDIPSIPSRAFFRDLLIDDRGVIWIASSRGLARFDGKNWRILTVRDGLESPDLDVVSQAQGSIWVGYRDALGMTRLQGTTLTPSHITVQDGLHSNQVYAIKPDQKGRLWVSTDTGMDVLEAGKWRHYGSEDGLIWNDTDSLALRIDSEDNVWIGTSAGLSKFAQPEFSIKEQPPLVVLTSITGNSQKWQASDDPALPFSQRSLSIQYAALSYESASAMRFRYRLAGFEDKWTETNERNVRFAALPSGHYVFEITAAGPNGLWNQTPARFVFSIRSPWWATWWFIGSSIVLTLLIGFSFLQLRIRVLQRQKRGLEQQVADRTAELVTSHRQLEEIAYYDALTNTPNRRMFVEEFRKRLAHATHSDPFTLLLIDLDFFKGVNDRFGHDAGDSVLVAIASRLKAEVRPADCVARLGGDEFALLLSATTDVAAIEAICTRILTSVATPISYRHMKLQVGCSIGIARHPMDGNSQEGLYKSADMALYEAKQTSRNAFCWHKPQENDGAPKASLEQDLQDYLNQDEIQVAFQPIYSVIAKKIVGLEALARWSHPERGEISPKIFIPIAEETGLIQKLSSRVLATACRQTAVWNKLWDCDLFVSVNISVRQFSNPALLPSILQTLENSDLAARRLHLEITESALLLNDTIVERTLAEARNQGIGISLDDFGTGYSSLSYLLNLPVDELKIDQSFIHDLEFDRRRVELVKTVLSLGRTLGKRVVAEGVETTEQFEILRRLGCEYVQGYLISKPLGSLSVEGVLFPQVFHTSSEDGLGDTLTDDLMGGASSSPASKLVM
jgi:diguanylate cyclase (GGDEF)-like protein